MVQLWGSLHTALFVESMFSSKWENLKTFGFKNHIVFCRCYLNKIINLFQANMVYTIENHKGAIILDSGFPNTNTTSESAFNDGIGISSVLSEEGGSWFGSNGLTILGGWINYCTWDLSNIENSNFSGLDFEPVSNTLKVGNSNTFQNCRFERFNYRYEQIPVSERPYWFEIGSDNIFKNNSYHESGANSPSYFHVRGENNNIEFGGIPYLQNIFVLNSNSRNNQIYYSAKLSESLASDGAHFFESQSISDFGTDNKIIYDIENKKLTTIGDYISFEGKNEVICKFEDLNNSSVLSFDPPSGYTKNYCDIPVPNKSHLDNFIKLNGVGTININTGTLAPSDGNYTISCMVRVNYSMLLYGRYLGQNSDKFNLSVKKGEWVYLKHTAFYSKDEEFKPILSVSGVPSSNIYLGNITICKGDVAYFENSDEKFWETYNAAGSYDYFVLPSFLKGKSFDIKIESIYNKNQYFIARGNWGSGNTDIPILTYIYRTVEYTPYETNSYGTVSMHFFHQPIHIIVTNIVD